MIRQDWSTLKKLMFMKAAAGGGAAVEATATGNPLTFLTDLARPLKSLLIPFTPVQSGTGDPSPQNIRSILPWDGLSVWNGGKNLFNKETVSTGVWWKGSVLGGYPNHRASALIPVKAGSYYTIDRNSNAQNAVCLFDKDRVYVDQLTFDNYIKARIIPDGICYVGITVSVDALDTAIVCAGQTASAYEPYKPITETDIVFPSPVYGGTLDVVSGVLTVTHKLVKISSLSWAYQANWNGRFRGSANDKDGVQATVTANVFCDSYKSELGTNSNDNIVCGYGKGIGGLIYIKDSSFGEDAEAFVETMGEHYICYPVVNPQTVTLTPTQLTALIGNNTIWSDADGQMTAIYLKKG